MEHLDVLVVGAGISGIGAGHYLQTQCPWARYAIFEARGAIGGTWDLFRYPGIRSDSDMHTLGYAFRPWPGEKTIADGESIRAYIKETATAEGIDQKIRFHHRIVRADWSTAQARWHITAERTDTGERSELTCNFLFSCAGYYRYDHGYLPDFAGLDQFKGTLVHPQAWPEDLDYAGKRVIVIGSGATAITLIPSLAKTATHVTMLQRSPTYIAVLPSKSALTGFLRQVLPADWAGDAIRWFNALSTQAFFQVSRRFPDFMRGMLRKGITPLLPPGYDIDTHFSPRYNPWDQRVCLDADGDLFRAIRQGTASVVTDHIDTFTEHGIRLKSGTEINADIIITATGLELLFLGGIDVSLDGQPVQLSERMTYKGMMLEGIPNAAMAIGYTNASWTLKCELTCDYVTRILNHMHTSGLRQCMPVNHDPTNVPEPLLPLTSGYVQRSAGIFPKQGQRFPWQVYQSYLRDYRAMKLADVVDDTLSFSNPAAPAQVTPSLEPQQASA